MRFSFSALSFSLKFVSWLEFADDARLGRTVGGVDLPRHFVPQLNEKTPAAFGLVVELLLGRRHGPDGRVTLPDERRRRSAHPVRPLAARPRCRTRVFVWTT